MSNSYKELITQTFRFPQEGFEVADDHLFFNDVNLYNMIREHGTPLKISYLPKISEQIQKAKKIFNDAMSSNNYQGNYEYCYCTKSAHFSFILDEVLKNDVHLETSSAFDINLVRNLYEQQKISKDIYIICNGYKPLKYAQEISSLIESGFDNVIPVLDNEEEVTLFDSLLSRKCQVGIRIASEERTQSEFYTSRLGVKYDRILGLYEEKLKNHRSFDLKMLHIFLHSGIEDTTYYWSELERAIKMYCKLKKVCPSLSHFNIGGGFPIRNTLNFDYDYGYMAKEIILQVKKICSSQGVPEPNIFTEFGNFTVGESGAIIFSVLGQKLQNDRELWYMIDSSLMTTLPDIFATGQRFVLLPINKWGNKYHHINIGGLSCDADDYYHRDARANKVYLPKIDNEEQLFVGFFHVGAYQDALSGHGSLKHCLIPAPKHLLIDKDDHGIISEKLIIEEQLSKDMLTTLGY